MKEKVAKFVKDRAMLEHGQTLEVNHLWDGRFRVNIWQFDPKTQIVASFFIKTNGSQILTSNPSLGEPDVQDEPKVDQTRSAGALLAAQD